MNAVQVAALALVAVTGSAVALASRPLRQTLLLGIYGMSLTVMFFSFQAPDVALSEIVVSTVALPLIILAALRKISEREREQQREEER